MDRFLRLRPAARTAAASIFCTAFSISYAQSFLGLSLLFALIEIWQERKTRIREPIPNIFIAGLGLFAWLILSWTIHWAFASATARNLVRGEAGDLFLCIFGLNIFYLTRDADNRRIIYRGFLALSVLVILSGAASVFTEHRLARLIYGKGFLSHSETRAQHLFAVIHDFAIYRPIGLLNTRLTYAGQLILILPFVFLECLIRKKDGWLWIVLFVIGCIVLVLNGTRSAMLGLAFASCVFIYQWLAGKHSSQSPDTATAGTAVGVFRIRRMAAFAFLAGIAIALSAGMWIRPEFLMGRQTDFQRPILWSGSFEIFQNNFLIGTGPGDFGKATLAWRDAFALEHPTIWYYLLSTPSGHAHNDLLHLLAVGGVPAGLIFITIIASLPGTRSKNASTIALGLIAFYVAGIAQCYFQDDEVVLLFWALAGFASRLDVEEAR